MHLADVPEVRIWRWAVLNSVCAALWSFELSVLVSYVWLRAYTWTMMLMQLMKFFMVSCAQDVEIDIAQLALGAGKDGPSEGR